MSDRPESGPMEFDGDWAGVFIRGDNAFYYAAQLNATLELIQSEWGGGYVNLQIALKALKSILASCNSNITKEEDKQLMKKFEDCKR